MELKCAIQQYAWGKYGRSSEVALLNSSGNPDFVIEDAMPYAELWMGTHPSGPSVLRSSNQQLGDWIRAHPESLGAKTKEKFGLQLPFLFKVLSVSQALSIQAHPDKTLAEQLHREHPDIYKDPNHKPELAIALTCFEALCGFRPIEEIKYFLEVVPELRTVIGEEAVNELLMTEESTMHQALKKCFHSLMTCPKEMIETQLQILERRLVSLDESSQADQKATLFLKLHHTYPGDVGCFSIYFLNHLVLQPGEALYLTTNEPHAYLHGDCIECMACSDNVVRAGLTPKPRDVETLCSMLTYSCEPESAKRFQGIQEDEYTVRFSPPIPDFSVAKICVPVSTTNYSLIQRDSASIVIVISGHATAGDVVLKRGTIIFLPSNEVLNVHCGDSAESLLMFQAMSNV